MCALRPRILFPETDFNLSFDCNLKLTANFNNNKSTYVNIPGGLVVKTPHFQCWGHGFDP